MDKLTDEAARAAKAKAEMDIRDLEDRISHLSELETGYRNLISRTEQDMIEIRVEMAASAANWVLDQARRGREGGGGGSSTTSEPGGPPGQEQRLQYLEEAQVNKSGQEHELRRILMRKKETQDALDQAQLTLAMEKATIGEDKK